MRKFSVILFFFAAFVCGTVNAQSEHAGMGMIAPGVVAKPSFETTENGFLLKVWIMSVIEEGIHVDTNAIQNNSETDEKKNGTHHIIAEVRDATEGKEITGANVKVELLSPTGKTDVVDLDKLMNQYGGDIALSEKGEYKLKLNVSTEDGRNVKVPFSYMVR